LPDKGGKVLGPRHFLQVAFYQKMLKAICNLYATVAPSIGLVLSTKPMLHTGLVQQMLKAICNLYATVAPKRRNQSQELGMGIM
jgi:hypothetical protein